MKKTRLQKGFVSLFVALLAAVILTISIGVASVSLKELALSSTASQASRAFYAANSAVECVLFFDRTTIMESEDSIECVQGQEIFYSIETLEEAGDVVTSFYKFNNEDPFTLVEDLCVEVDFKKVSEPGIFYRVLQARGYNVGCDVLEEDGLGSSRIVERFIEVQY